MFNTRIGSVHPAGGSAAQRTARANTRNQGYRQQVVATRQIQQRQQPRILANPRQDVFRVQERQRQQQQADRRLQHIAVQNVRLVQDQVADPRRATHVLAGQAYQQLRRVADVGRLTSMAENTHLPLEHRVGALRSLRSRYGIPVTPQGFKQFRQAQAFHQFLTHGSEGDTFSLPGTPKRGGGLAVTRPQTYQLRKAQGELVPVAVHKDRTLLDAVTGKAPHYFADKNALAAIGSGGIAPGFFNAGVDTAHYGAKAIPEGKVGTPLRKAVTEVAALGPNTITGLYGLGAAGVAAAGGNTKPIRAMAKSFTEDDPVGRLIAHRDLKAFAGHPGIAAVELLGGLTAIDRAAGRVARRGAPQAIRSVRTAPLTGLARQERYSKGYLMEGIQRRRDTRTDAKFNDLRRQAEQEVAAARAAEPRTVRGQKTVQRPARPVEVHDPRATRKSIARQERRRVDRPFIQPHEVKDFQKGAKYSGVLYHVTDPETAKIVAKHGLDPSKAQRGTYGLGTYSASVPENIPGATHSVKVAVRMKNPLVIDSNEAMTALKPYRDAAVAKVGKEDLRLLSAEMTRGLQKAGYDGVVVKGAMRGGDYVVNFHPQDVRVLSGRQVARRGGRTSAVLERNLPPETRTAPAREVKVTTTRRVGGDAEARSGHLKKAQDLAQKAERHNRGRVREGFDVGSPNRTQLRGDLDRLGDVAEGTNQAASRQTRAGAIREVAGQRAVREKNKRPGVVRTNDAEAEVQGMIAEARVAPHRAELAKVAKRLEQQTQHLTDHHDVATNRHEVQSIREVLKTHNDEQLRLLGDDARRYAQVNVRAHDIAKENSIGTAAEFDMSAAKPFAVEQMGARSNAQGKLVVIRKAPADLSHWEGRVRKAGDDLQRAKQNGLGGLATKETRLREARQALEKQKGRGRTVDVEHVLTLDEIHAAMNAYAEKFPGALRPGEQAFISHSSKIRGPGVFNIRADTAKGLARARRTGNAVVYGTASVGRDAMLGAVVKLHNMAQQVRSFRETIKDAAGREPSTGNVIRQPTSEKALQRWNALQTDANGLPKPGFVEGIAIRLNPLGGREEQMARTLHEVDAEGFAHGEQQQAVAKTLQDALEGKDVGAGDWTVIPADFAARLREHATVSAGASPLLRTVSQAFRKTVLPFSPTWLTGNAVESLGRSVVNGWRPGDSDLERRAISEWAKLDPERASRALLAIGTGHMGSADMWKVRNTANSIKGPLKPIYALGDRIVKAEHGGKQIQWGADAIRAYTDWMMNTVNSTMEQAIKRGMVGTEMRKLLPPDLPAATEAAARYIAGELHSNPAALQELVSRVQRAYGAYEHFTPEMRRTIINYTPFGAWVFNAVTFLTRVLPADHPGVLALLAANVSATRQYRRENGLDAEVAGEKNSGQVPPFLLGSVPTPAWYARLTGSEKGAPLRLARYTPFGIATDPTSTVASMFMPQIPLEVLQGYDFAGRPLRNKDGTPYDPSQLVTQFGLNFALGTIPLFGQISRGLKTGPLGVINPFQPVRRKADASGRGGGGGGGGAWGAAAGTHSPGGGGGWGAAAGTGG